MSQVAFTLATDRSLAGRTIRRVRGDQSRLRAVRSRVFDRFPRLTGWLVRGVAKLIPFEVWERHGSHLTANHFYSPIPDVSSLPDSVWIRRSELVGVDMRADEQRALIARLATQYGAEIAELPLEAPATPGGFYLRNDNFEGLDAQFAYAFVRELKPSRIIEIGSGWSTLVVAQAIGRNAAEGWGSRMTCIEPYPRPFLRDAIAREPEIEFLEAPVQDVPLERFDELGDGDVLFIDSSHVVRIGGDVTHECLEILPRLAVGVVVHLHDIFLPFEYPRDWIERKRWFWSEQYLVQAFLTCNDSFEVVWSSHLMALDHADELARRLPSFERDRGAGSLWLRRYR